MYFNLIDDNKWMKLKNGERYRIAKDHSYAEVLQSRLTALQLCHVLYKENPKIEFLNNTNLIKEENIQQDYDAIESCLELVPNNLISTSHKTKKKSKKVKEDKSRNKKNHRSKDFDTTINEHDKLVCNYSVENNHNSLEEDYVEEFDRYSMFYKFQNSIYY